MHSLMSVFPVRFPRTGARLGESEHAQAERTHLILGGEKDISPLVAVYVADADIRLEHWKVSVSTLSLRVYSRPGAFGFHKRRQPGGSYPGVSGSCGRPL
jgi:hypothetical protein